MILTTNKLKRILVSPKELFGEGAHSRTSRRAMRPAGGLSFKLLNMRNSASLWGQSASLWGQPEIGVLGATGSSCSDGHVCSQRPGCAANDIAFSALKTTRRSTCATRSNKVCEQRTVRLDPDLPRDVRHVNCRFANMGDFMKRRRELSTDALQTGDVTTKRPVPPMTDFGGQC